MHERHDLLGNDVRVIFATSEELAFV